MADLKELLTHPPRGWPQSRSTWVTAISARSAKIRARRRWGMMRVAEENDIEMC